MWTFIHGAASATLNSSTKSLRDRASRHQQSPDEGIAKLIAGFWSLSRLDENSEHHAPQGNRIWKSNTSGLNV